MTTQNQTSKQYFRSLALLYYGLLIGQISFAAITLILNLGLIFQPYDSLRDIFIIIVPVFIVSGFVSGHLIYKNRLKVIRNYNSLTSKMAGYRNAFIIRLAMLEAASIFAIVVYLFTADFIFLVMTGLILAYFILLKPTIFKISSDMELNSTERSRIENPHEIIAEVEID